MTGQLQTTLQHRAAELDRWEADLDAIVGAGDRRVRRRRVAIAGGLAGVLAVVGSVSALAVNGHRTGPAPADQDAKPLTYAAGNVIHDGDTQVDVGMQVDSFVRLTDRFVYTHADHVYEARDGRVHLLDPLADPSTPLVAGEDGRKVGWFGLSPRYGAGLEIYPGFPQVGDNPNGSYADYPDSWPQHSPPGVLAVSGNYVWATDGSRTQVYLHDPTSGEYVSWHIPTTGPTMVQDAAGDSLLVRIHGGLAVMSANLPPTIDAIPTWNTKRNVIPDAAQVPGVDTGDLAPDAQHWFTTEGGFTVYASSNAEPQEPEHAGYEDVTPYQWLSSDTIAATGHRDGAPDGTISLLTCRVSTNQCTDALTDVGSADQVVLPNGPTTGTR